jgi:ABC-2 type transport system permease protein
VQSTRLTQQGIDPSQVAGALKPVQLEAEKTGGKGVTGSAAGGQMIGFFMAFAIYLVVLLYGAAIMNGVLEEKRDKIVEVIVSSLRARDLMIGKVLGIAGAGMLQMLVWVLAVGLVLAYAGSIATLLNLSPEKAQAFNAVSQMLPKVPLSVGIIFLLFFAGGFFIYSTLYATIGSIATTNQEAQQLVFPAMMPLIIGFFMSMVAVENPDSGMSQAASLIPFTSPLVMPIRAVGGSASTLEIILSLVLLVVTGLAILWLAAKIYRVGIFATGKRPTMSELGRWLRAS